MKLKFNFDAAFRLAIFFLIIASFFSIPALSFRVGLHRITWVLIVLMVVMMVIYIIISKRFVFDIVSASFLLFAFSSLISSMLSGFKAFRITAPALSLLSFVVYSYCKSLNKNSKRVLFGIYIGDILFLFFYFFHYRTQLLALDFSRLGGYFGDINDISLFMSLGMVFSLYYLLFSKKLFGKIVGFIFSFLFFVGGISSGSKIFVISFAIIFIALVFLFFGKKKWWISLIIVIAFFGLFILILQLPALSTIRKRMIDFLFTMTGNSSDRSASVDLSTLDRMNMFVAGMEMFLRKPFFGWGIWGFATYGGINNGWSHNNFSETLCNFGLVGTIFFHYPIYKSIASFIKKRDKTMYLSFLLLLFFIVSMFSVALNSEKIYAIIAPMIFATMCHERALFISITNKINRKKENAYENN